MSSGKENENAKNQIFRLLSERPIDWGRVHDSLGRFPGASNGGGGGDDSCHAGRAIVNKLVSANPPLDVLAAALVTFPNSLAHNPTVFFAACNHATSDVVSFMMSHASYRATEQSNNSGGGRNGNAAAECLYPWILSSNVPVDGARAIVEACPEGVLKPASSMSGLCPLDFFLLSPLMMSQRSFDVQLWAKFKLMLLAAECSEMMAASPRRSATDKPAPSPAHVMMRRVFAHPDFFVNPQLAHHCLWILHQLRWTDPWIFRKRASAADGSDQGYPLHVVLSHKCQNSGEASVGASRELIKILLEACPESARYYMPGGRSALHMAIENGWPCYDLLLMIHPDALNDVDPLTGLFPFQCSALYDACRSTRQTSIAPVYTPSVATTPTPPTDEVVNVCDISLTFQLLRASPGCCAGAAVYGNASSSSSPTSVMKAQKTHVDTQA